MKRFWPILLLSLFLYACDGDTPNTTSQTPSTATQLPILQNTSGVGLTLKWPQPNFQTQKIPATATSVQIEITEVGTFQNLYRTTVQREDVTGDQTTRQIRVDMQGKSEREVLVLVTAKDARNGVVAKGEKTFTLKAGTRSAIQLEVLEVKGTVVIGGGGGGGGGGGNTGGGGNPVPTPVPTQAPTSYTLTPLSSTLSMSVGETVDIPIKVWNGSPIYTFTLSARLPEGIDLFNGENEKVPEDPEGFIASGALLQSGDTIYLRGTVAATGNNFELNISSVTDAGNQFTSRNYPILIRQPNILPAQISTPAAGAAFSQSFKVMNATGPYTWSRTGSLPPGLTLDTSSTSDTVVLTGTPGASINDDAYLFTLQVTDGQGRVSTQSYVLGCGDGAIVKYKDAQPVVNSVSPVAAGNNEDQPLTIVGEKFTANSVVYLDQLALNTTYVSATQLQVTVPAGVKPGQYDIIVANPATLVGRIEGGLALAYEVTEAGGFVSAAPEISGLYARSTPVTSEVTNEQLQAQLLTAGEQTYALVDRDAPENAFMSVLIVGKNFGPNTQVTLSAYTLPSVYINESQILTVVPISQLFPDGSTAKNTLVLVNKNLEKSSLLQGQIAITSTSGSGGGDGSGAPYLAYVYPQKGPANKRVVVYARGCGFERSHRFRLSTQSGNLERVVETSTSTRLALPENTLFPSTQGYDLSVFRVVQGLSVTPAQSVATGAYKAISTGLKVTGCQPNAIGTNTTLGISVKGEGFIPGMKVDYILQNPANAPADNLFSSLATVTSKSDTLIPIVSAGMPAGEYKVRVTAPSSDIYPGGQVVETAGTCLTLTPPPALSNPQITSITPSTVSNNETEPFDLTITGSGFVPGAEISIGGRTVSEGGGSGSTTITISSNNFLDMAPGTYPLYVQNLDGQIAQLPNAITVTDGGGIVASPPQVFNVRPQYTYQHNSEGFFYSLILGLADGEVKFTAGAVAPGALFQLVENPTDPVRPDEAYLSRISSEINNPNELKGYLPNLPGGTLENPKNYYLRLLNADGQAATALTPIRVVNAPAPEIETNLTALQDSYYSGCNSPICPSGGPQSVPVNIKINGVLPGLRNPAMNFGKHPANSAVQLVSEVNSDIVINVSNVRAYEGVITGTVPDGVQPGTYRVRVINPDGQSNDVTNSGSKKVTYQVFSAVSKWDKSAKMPDEIFTAGGHGRVDSTVALDPDTQKMYFFGGNDGRGCANLPTRHLLSYSATSGWDSLGLASAVPTRTGNAFTFKRDSGGNDKLFMFGGLNFTSSGGTQACPFPNVVPTSFLNDLWMYNVQTETWVEIALDTVNQGNGNPLPQLIESPGLHWSSGDNALYIYGGLVANTGLSNNTIYKVTVNETTHKYTWAPVTPTNANLNTSALPLNILNDYKVLSDPAHDRFFVMGGRRFVFTDQNQNDKYDTGEPVPSAVLNDDIFMYDVALNKWAKLSQSGSGYASRYRFGASIDNVGERLYVYGGRGSSCSDTYKQASTCSRKDRLQIGQFSNFTGSADNPPSLVWSTEDTVPVEQRGSHLLQWADNGLYLFGGLKANGVALYNESSSTSPLTPTGQPDVNHDPATDFWQYIP